LPPSWEPGSSTRALDSHRTMFITVHPDQVHPGVLSSVGTVIAVGAAPEETIGLFCQTQHEERPKISNATLESGQVLVWQRQMGQSPRRVRVAPSRVERRRHIRKYAEGELPPDRSFYFRGAQGKLKLRAQNLIWFMQLADGVDDETWQFHLRQGDYSDWFRTCIKDDGLAAEAEAIERQTQLSADDGRALIRDAIERRYTQPASEA
jgi:hypothetical protein